MARGSKKEGAAADPEAEERERFKKLAFSKGMLSQTAAKVSPSAALGPSKTVIKHHGRDILRKSQRKNRYLFSFPGLLGPISGGKIGELKDLGTKNPILYLDFPQGRMKLFGTIVYPKNRYLTLQFSKGGKSVTCDDYFDNMIVFSDAWWIGNKEDNPKESRLQFPEDLNMEKDVDYDFKGGVGASFDGKQGSAKSAMKCLEKESPNVCLDDDNLTDSQNDNKKLTEVTPTRQSARTSGKTFNFAEASSGDDLMETGDETSEEEDKKPESSSPIEIDHEDDSQGPPTEQCKQTGKAKDPSVNDRTSLVQTTLSSLFKKVEEKKGKKDVKQKIGTSKASKHTKGENKTEEAKSATVKQRKSKVKTSGTSSSKKVQAELFPSSQLSDSNSQAEDDDIEEYSSTSKDMDASDDDWTA